MTLTCKRKLYFGNATSPETLIVIAVLGIVAAVALPMFSEAKIKAKKASTMEILQHLIHDAKRQNNEEGQIPASFLKSISTKKDSWGNSLSATFKRDVLSIKSAGVDGIHGNGDDLEQVYEWQLK